MLEPKYTLGLVDVNGAGLSENGLLWADDRRLTLQAGSAPRMFSFTLPTRAPECQAILTGRAYVKVYRRAPGASAKTLVFYGPVWGRELVGERMRMAFTAIDPTVYFTKRDTGMNATSDQGTILKTMVDLTQSVDGELGIRTNAGLITPSATATVELASQVPTLASIQQQFASQLDGCESWVEPIELTGGKICDFYAAPQQGAYRPGATFAQGKQTVDNCILGFSESMDNVENDVMGYSDKLSYNALDLTSIAAHRRLKSRVSFTGETTLLRLTSRTLGRISERFQPDQVGEWTARPGLDAPRPFDEWVAGDTVPVEYDDGHLEFRSTRRIMTADIDIARTGAEKVAAIRFRSLAA